MTQPALRILVWTLALWLAACGGGPDPEYAEEGDSSGDAEEAEAGPPTWDDYDRAGLIDLVRSRSRARIASVEPDLDLAGLDGWIADPASAPELGDRVSEQMLHLAIASAAAGENERAAGIVRLVRQRARNRNNAFVSNTVLTELARRGAGDGDQVAAVRAVLETLPSNRFGGSTVVYRFYQNAEQVTARVELLHTQLVGLDTAVSVLFYEGVLSDVVANRDAYLEAIGQIEAAREGQPEPEPYAFSTVDLTRDRRASEVRVAVWDTGVAGNLFEDQLFANAAEEANGEDDDGNGLVDDIHGVVADPTPGQTGLTFDPGDDVVREYAGYLQGTMDLRAGLGSTDAARRVLELAGSIQDAEALEELQSHLGDIGEWAHGTHVAGILLAGVPTAKVAVFRSAWAGERRLYHHRGPTDEELAAERANVEAIAAFINAHDIQVVNASLGFTQDYLEAELRFESDTYPTEEAVRARAEAVHAQRAANWRWVMEASPNTLFVVSAGNSNRDVVEYEDVPCSFSLPNLLVVGAVDAQGNWATFTNSNPERVRIFDHGVAVPSLIPNGDTVPLSGTSMASPNVANLAAKLLAVNPELTPAQLIEIIIDTGTPIPSPFYGRIAHEGDAIARARPRRRVRR